MSPAFNDTVEALRDAASPSPPPPRRRRGAVRGFAVAAVLVGAGWFASEAVGERPSSREETQVVVSAALHLSAVGVPTTVPPVFVMTDPADCGDPGAVEVAAYACADPDRGVILSPEAAADARVFARLVANTSRRARARALRACWYPCASAMSAALHELVHWNRFQRPGVVDAWDPSFEEGLAEAVASDQEAPFQFRVAGVVVASSCGSYLLEVDAVRALSARAVGGPWWSAPARRWRLSQVVAA